MALQPKRNIYLYNSLTKATVVIKNEINESITDIEQIDETHYFYRHGCRRALCRTEKQCVALSPCEKLDTLRLQINELFFQRQPQKSFIGTFQRGIYVYDLNLHRRSTSKSGLIDVSINRICTFGEKDILIATDGAGVYKMDVDTYRSEPYIVADFNRYNAMNGNTIYDIYVDNEQRILDGELSYRHYRTQQPVQRLQMDKAFHRQQTVPHQRSGKRRS